MESKKTDNDLINNLIKKINVIWYGALIVVVLIIPIVGWTVNDVYNKILSIETRLSVGKDNSLERERDIEDSFYDDIVRLEKQISLLERHVLIILMNQKRMMLGLEMSYIEPYNDKTIEDIIQEFVEINKEK